MAVTFTPNIALAKPTEAELGENWVNNTKLQEDNNIQLLDATQIATVTYTPTIIGQSGNPSVGAGFIKGEWIDLRGFIMGTVVVKFTDPGIAAGSGEYGISLPFTADSSYHNVGTALNNSIGTFSCIGEGYIFDFSAVGKSGSVSLDVVTITGVSYMRMIPELYSSPVKTARVYSNGQPTTPADGDSWNLSFMYKKT